MSRVLFFSPYAKWSYHTALEATWAHALKLRGAEVQFVLCDGLSRTCDVYRSNLNPRTELSCLECQAGVTSAFSQLAMPYEWLSRYLPLRAQEKAEAWAARLAPEQMLEARWRGLDVGRWAATSAYYQFRTADLRLDDPAVLDAVRNLLVGTVVILEAMDNLLEVHRPDTLALLNGRFFGHWTAIELAKLKGIRFVTHERGLAADTVRFNDGLRLHELQALRDLWQTWRDVPLAQAELEEVARTLEDRRQGRNFSRMSFSPPLQDHGRVRKQLGLDGRPLVAVFTSSDDETAAFPDRRRGAFPQPEHFLPAVLDLARARPDTQFVIRIHPNITKAQAGTNSDALQHARDMGAQAPANVRVVMPDEDISSYTLVDLADVGLVYASTIGLELAAIGKPVLCVAQATYSHTGCVQQVDGPEDLGPALDGALERGPDPEIARVALRWAYRYFRECSIPFDLVHGPPDDGAAQLRYTSIGQLALGRHETLDRVCALLLGERSSVLPGPTDTERGRSQETETQALTAWLGKVSGCSPASA
jgi:Capsule polysaccharide biosynthesis protein